MVRMGWEFNGRSGRRGGGGGSRRAGRAGAGTAVQAGAGTAVRAARVVAALAVAAPVLAGCSGSPSHHEGAAPTPPAHRVSFQVAGSGTADLDYSTGAAATSGRARNAALPWSKTVRAAGAAYTLTVVLGRSGGDASCSISVDGRRRAGSHARGAYGRATCATGTAPADG